MNKQAPFTVLREIDFDDAPALLKLLQAEAEAGRLTLGGEAPALEQAQSFILRAWLTAGQEYRVVADAEGRFLGLIGLRAIAPLPPAQQMTAAQPGRAEDSANADEAEDGTDANVNANANSADVDADSAEDSVNVNTNAAGAEDGTDANVNANADSVGRIPAMSGAVEAADAEDELFAASAVRAEFCVALLPEARGQGRAQQAARQLLAYAFGPDWPYPPLQRIYMYTAVTNAATRRFNAACGFFPAAPEPDAAALGVSEPLAAYCWYGLTRQQYAAR